MSLDESDKTKPKTNSAQQIHITRTIAKSSGQPKIYLHYQAKKKPHGHGHGHETRNTCTRPNRDTSAPKLQQEELEHVRQYEYLLKMHLAITPVDEHYHVFAVQEFEKTKRKLKKHSYVILRRKAIHIGGQTQFIYACSCNNNRVELVNSLPDHCQDRYDSLFSKGFEDCIHLLATQRLFSNFDQQNEISAADVFTQEREHEYAKDSAELDKILCLLNDAGSLMVRRTNTYSLVIVNCHGKLECRACLHKYTCCHIQVVKQSLEDGNPELQEFQEILNYDGKTEINIPTVISRQKIRFLRNEQHDGQCEKKQFFPDDTGQCSHGHPWCVADPAEDQWVDKKCHLYSEYSVADVTVHWRPCSDTSCHETKLYDGKADGILNMSQFLISHGVLRAYMRMFLICGTPLTAFYRIWSWQLLDCGISLPATFSCEKFRHSWYGFLKLIDLNRMDSFRCGSCGPEPDTVIMDGLTLGMQRRYMNWKDSLQQDSKLLTGSRHRDRVFIPNEECRRLLSHYSMHGCEDEDSFRRLLELVDAHQPALGPLLRELQEEDNTVHPPKSLGDFLKALSCSTPVSALISQSEELHQALIDVANGEVSYQTPGTFKLIQEEAPVILKLLRAHRELPESCGRLIKEICRISRDTFQGEEHDLPASNREDTASHFPSLPVKCARGTYAMDKEKGPEKDCDKKKCHKKTKGHLSLSPGIFIMLCPHGVCYGYSTMKTCESPNVPFTVIRTRYTKAPKRVVYDNACNLHAYCLNRDPVFFKNTKFLVDRFHWRNHKGCSEAHNASTHGNMQHVNTQVAEQCNAHLKKLRPMLAYMNLDNFSNHIVFTLWFYNLCKSEQPHGGLQKLKATLKKY